MSAFAKQCGCKYLPIFSKSHTLSRTGRPTSAGWIHSASQAVETTSSSSSSSSTPPQHIIIPKRVQRDELSVLRALSKTVKKDFAAPPYHEFDDPFLTPVSIAEKSACLLAKAQGRHAARYAMKEYPDSFQVSPIQPKLDMDSIIEAFRPPEGFCHDEASLPGLQERLDHRSPLTAYSSYQQLLVKGEVVPSDLTHDLLDLLCYYNSSEVEEQGVEEEQPYWSQLQHRFQRMQREDNMQRKTWLDHGAAEELFMSMEEKTPRAYCSMIRGRAKFFQCDGAYALYQEMVENKIAVSHAAYNALISVAYIYKQEQNEEITQLFKGLLRSMAGAGVQPDIDTFSAVLSNLFRMRFWVMAPSITESVLSEMRRLNIEPDLHCWDNVVLIFALKDFSTHLVYETLDYLEGKEFSARTPNDLRFFSNMMAMCKKRLKDMQFAYKVDRLLNTGRNTNLLVDNLHQQTYFFNYLSLLCTFEQMDKVISEYERFTPHSYVPIMSIMEVLLETVELNEAFYYLPKIWSDMTMFLYHRKADLVEIFFRVMTKADKTDTQLQEKFLAIAVNVISTSAEMSERAGLITGSLLGCVVEIYLNLGNYEKAWEVFEKYYNKKRTMANFPSEDSLVRLMEAAIERQNLAHITAVVEIMSDVGYPRLDVMVNKVFKEVTLTQQQKDQLDDLL